jgi:hypothetical protein
MKCPICNKGVLVFHVGDEQQPNGRVQKDKVLMIECATEASLLLGSFFSPKSECSIPANSELFIGLAKLHFHEKETVKMIEDFNHDVAYRLVEIKTDRQIKKEDLEKRVNDLAQALKKPYID